MNIDLFTSGHGECGLLCTAEFPDLPAGVIFDAETMELTVEFLEFDPFHLNIPVEGTLADSILMAKHIFIAYLNGQEISDTVMAPLLYLNDPYGGEFQGTGGLAETKRSLVMFKEFMKRCNFAQAAHRDDLDNEESSGSILRGRDPKALEFAPQLVRQQQLETGLRGPTGPSGPSGPEQSYTPPAPMGPMPMGPGMRNSGASFRTRKTPKRRPPPKDTDEN